MKCILIVFAFLFSISTLAQDEAKKPAQKAELTIRADIWCPYTCDPKSTNPGLLVEVAREALVGSGFSFKYEVSNWARLTADVQKGSIPAVFGGSPQVETALLYPKARIFQSATVVFSKKTRNLKFPGIEKLSQHSVALIKGYEYPNEDLMKFIKQHEKDPRKVSFAVGDDAVSQNIKKLASERVDFVIEDRLVFLYEVKSLGLNSDDFEELTVLNSIDVDLALSPQYPQARLLLEAYDKGLSKLKSSGRLNELAAKYGVQLKAAKK